MKYINPHEFYLETNGKKIDVDGAYGGQCWDLFAYFCQKYCGRTFSCIATGYVIDLWTHFEQCGLNEYFDKVTSNYQDGDWFIWKAPCYITRYSHIAMFRLDNGDGTNIILTQNPNGNPNYTHQMICNYDGLVGALRPKTNQPKKVEVLSPNPIDKNINVNQVYIKANDTIYCRLSPNKTIENKTSDNFIKVGYYNILSETNGQGYHWYEIEKDRWIAQVDGYVEYIAKYVAPKEENSIIIEPVQEENPSELVEVPKNDTSEQVGEQTSQDSPNTSKEVKVPKIGFKTIIIEVLKKILEYLRKRFLK